MTETESSQLARELVDLYKQRLAACEDELSALRDDHAKCQRLRKTEPGRRFRLDGTLYVDADGAQAWCPISADGMREKARMRELPHTMIDGTAFFEKGETLRSLAKEHLQVLPPIGVIAINNGGPASVNCDALQALEGRLLEFPIALVPCVYFLISKGAVMYIGQSVNLPLRLSQHFQRWDGLDRVLYMEVPRLQLNDVERRMIETLNPPWNAQRYSEKYKMTNLLEATADDGSAEEQDVT